MSRNPSEQFVHHLNWYVPATETSKTFAVYWGRLVHRNMIRLMGGVAALTVLLATSVIVLALLTGKPWYYAFSAFYISAIVFTVGAVSWGVWLAHKLGRDQAERDHRMYQQTLSVEPDILKDSPLAKFVPTRIP